VGLDRESNTVTPAFVVRSQETVPLIRPGLYNVFAIARHIFYVNIFLIFWPPVSSRYFYLCSASVLLPYTKLIVCIHTCVHLFGRVSTKYPFIVNIKLFTAPITNIFKYVHGRIIFHRRLHAVVRSQVVHSDFDGLNQGFPTWGTCTLRGTFAYLKGYIQGWQ